LVLFCLEGLIKTPNYLIAVIIITIPFTIIAIIFGSEAGNIKQAMKLMKKLKEEESDKGNNPILAQPAEYELDFPLLKGQDVKLVITAKK
jgi:hypothetical protein